MSTLFQSLSAKPKGFFFLLNEELGIIYKAWLPVKTEILRHVKEIKLKEL